MTNLEPPAILKPAWVIGPKKVTALLLLVLQSTMLVVLSMGADGGIFSLTVSLHDAYNPDIEIQTDLSIGKPFRIMKRNGVVENTVSGVLHRPHGKRYRLQLNISEWQSKAQNSSETYNLDLELDKPWTGGAIQSTVFRRTISLSRGAR